MCYSLDLDFDPSCGSKSKSKLQHNVEGPYQVLEVTERTAAIQRGGVVERVTLDRVIPAPVTKTERETAPPPVAVEHLPTPSDLAEKNLAGPSYLVDKITDHRVVGSGDDPVVSFFVHKVSPSRRRYEFLVHWVGYADPTWEPWANLPEELVTRYFQSVTLSATAQRRNARRRGRQRRVHFSI